MSLAQGNVPTAWEKIAHVTLIYKGKGLAPDPTNYRPNSRTNFFCKTIERLIRGKIVPHLKYLLSSVQSGFRKELSTLS